MAKAGSMRERDLAAVEARIERIRTTGKASLALKRGAVKDMRRLLRIIQDDHADLQACYLLGWMFWYRHRAMPYIDDELDAAVEMFTPCFVEGVEPLPEAVLPVLAESVVPIAEARLDDPVRLGQLHRLSDDIALWRRIAGATTADDPFRAARLTRLSFLLWFRFLRNGKATDVEESVAIARKAAAQDEVGDTDTAFRLSVLCLALTARFSMNGMVTDLDEAIETGREAITLNAVDTTTVMVRMALGTALLTRARMTGDDEDLEEAIVVAREAVQRGEAGDPDDASALSLLGGALLTRFERRGDLADVNEAITACRAAARVLPADHADRTDAVLILGEALKRRAFRTHSEADLNDAIANLRETLKISGPDNSRRHGMLSSLAGALHMRSEHTGDLADLDEAITLGRQAVTLTHDDHPDRPLMLANLARALQSRFGATGGTADLDQAIVVAREAANVVSPDSSARANVLLNLGSALQQRFVRTESREDIDEAVTACRLAVQTALGERAAALLHLSRALGPRFVAFEESADGEEAVAAAREAVAIIPADHSRRPIVLFELSRALDARFRLTGDETDLEESAALLREAIESTADDADRALYLSRLGDRLRSRFGRTGVPAERDEAVAAWSEAASIVTAPASWRIDAGWAAARLIADSDPGRAAKLLDAAVQLLPETAARHLHRSDRQRALGEYASLAADAAALTLTDTSVRRTDEERATRALRQLELGRGVLLSQALDTRSDFTDLQARHPTLAARFTELRDRLDADDTMAVPLMTGDAGSPQDWGVDRRRRIAAAFTATVTEIRALEGFESFLRPPEPSELVRHAAHGPIVVINVSRYRSDALLLTVDGIRSLKLPGIDAAALANTWLQALDAVRDPEQPARRRTAQTTIVEILEWLWDRITGPVLDELGYRTTPADGTEWPRVWWVPCGPLSLLPIHAAGYHRERPGASGRRAVMDRVISSYTPTVRTLGYARDKDSTSAVVDRALVVAMPTTPGAKPLHHAAREASLVQSRFSRPTALIGGDQDSLTTQRVLDQLSRCPVAHFACHGTIDETDPAQSKLLLHDHGVAPFTVARLASIQLDQVRLAYLSACTTALNPAASLVDEAVHLATAFQLVGYPHVIGTLWEVDDRLSADVAGAFYEGVSIDDGQIDPTHAARSLHQAVRTVRDCFPAAPSLWGGYLHVGA
ncbi:CHAT domain-containing protein [Actinomadura sp. KC216]|uniref:CHAT domain-containing tetratricopeptide repeat protein n=1 Tax=Actinomadura sp. KC216 TaxID=2530370 RepID=UPI00140447B4|nr:CHAT domain-containing protein [Actinomadura sp. KC216]